MYHELFNRKGLTLERLQALVKVADASSLIEAAGHSPVIQSLYSRQLRELENFFGCALTKRSGKALVMSEAGMRLARVSRLYLAGMYDFLQEQRNERSLIRVGAGERLIHWLIAPHLQALKEQKRGFAMALHHLRSSDIIGKLHQHELDVGFIRADRPVPRPLKAAKAGMLRYAYFATEAHLPGRRKNKTARMKVTIADIGDPARQRRHAAAAKALFGTPVVAKYICGNLPSVARIVRSGGAGAFLPVHAADDFRHDPVKTIELNPSLAIHETIWMVWNPRIIDLIPSIERPIDELGRVISEKLENSDGT